jgi:hypothetical protein
MKEGSGNGEFIINLIWAHFWIQIILGALNKGAIWNCCEGPGLL